MPRRAAGNERDAVDVREVRVREAGVVRENRARLERDAAEDGVAHGRRLLEDLLEHEVLVAGLLRGDGIPCDARGRLGDDRAGEIREHGAGLRDHGHFLIAEEHDVARVLQDGRDVGGDEVFALAETHDHRRTVPHGDELLRVIGRQQHQCEEAAQARHGAAHGAVEAVVLPLALDEMRHDFRVGLGHEGVALRLQLALQLEVVLDDAVVHHDDAALAVAVRMRVLFGGAAMRGPAGVTETVFPRQRVGGQRRFQVAELAGAAPDLELAVVDDGDAGRVIAAVLELPQPLDDERHDLPLPDVTDDSAHGGCPAPSALPGSSGQRGRPSTPAPRPIRSCSSAGRGRCPARRPARRR